MTLHASLTEKLLTLLLAKLVNFVPEGGIWMNTQRPEWNDANNALVGKGLSVVTLCYMRRTLLFCKDLFQQSGLSTVSIRSQVQQLYAKISQILTHYQDVLQGSFSDEQRRMVMDDLGQAGSDYRQDYYARGLQQEFTDVAVSELMTFFDLVQRYVDHTLHANKREDDLYHSYNILHLGDGVASIGYLYEMLEGQVAVLSSKLLSGEESLKLLESLRRGPLYCAEQHSYILYPDRDPLGFLEKNRILPEQVSGLRLVEELVEARDHTLFIPDVDGNYHFNGSIRNGKDVRRALELLSKQQAYAELVAAEAGKIEALFENVFRHAEFTGRSGTFFAYEGLGSIYWHMVSKFLLAVQETILRTRSGPASAALIERYADIRKGLGFNKSPAEYGAFPTDPYSHTPKDQGAKQPGMTGMVKEEILTRQGELGYSIADGRIVFDLLLLDRKELLEAASTFPYWSLDGQPCRMELPSGSLAYTICQVPILLRASAEVCIEVHWTDGRIQKIEGLTLEPVTSRHIFERDGLIHHLVVSC
jgi:hypothetical protein